MKTLVVRLMADAMCRVDARTPACDLCRAMAGRAYDALAKGGYLRDPGDPDDVHRDVVVERFGSGRRR